MSINGKKTRQIVFDCIFTVLFTIIANKPVTTYKCMMVHILRRLLVARGRYRDKPLTHRNAHEENSGRAVCCSGCQLRVRHMVEPRIVMDGQNVLKEANDEFHSKRFKRAEDLYTEFINICLASG